MSKKTLTFKIRQISRISKNSYSNSNNLGELTDDDGLVVKRNCSGKTKNNGIIYND
jgi:hypothetical protein